MTNVRNLIENAVAESLDRIRNHPFIQSANNGTLTQEQSIRWIMCAGRESRSFPHILERMIKDTKNPVVMDVLKENLDDEYGRGIPEDVHFHHYLHLLDALNIQRSMFDQYEERNGIKLALSLAYNVASASNEELALGYMLVNEGMTQITYDAVQNSLGQYYGNLSIPFFQIHVSVDEHHVEELYTVLDSMDIKKPETILFGISIGERGMAVLLDEAYGVFDPVPELPKFELVTQLVA